MNVGDRIDGRYRLQRLLGEGGMAAVYLAQDERLERPVAVKLLWSGPRLTPATAEAFLREARIAASIRHPNIVQVLDFGTHNEGAPYMVMEALDGEAMADRYARGYRFQVGEVVSITLSCLEGLAAVHATGIVHRDLKPENIFLAKVGAAEVPKLLDFGISRAADKSTGLRSAVTTREGRLVGTPEYMSPEQARGLADVDLLTDLYSLGVVMYEALWGRPPFESKNDGDLMIMVMAGNATPLETRMPQLSSALSKVVERAMAKDRAARFESAAAMHSALRAAWDGLLAQGAIPLLPSAPGQLDASDRNMDTTLNELVPEVRAAANATQVAQIGGSDRRIVLAAVLVAAVAVAGVLTFVLVRETRPLPTRGQGWIVVHSGATPAAPALSPPRVAVPASPAADSAIAQTAEPLDPKRKPTAVRTPTRPPIRDQKPVNDPGRTLARAFDQQKARVVECLSKNIEALPAEAELAVRIEIDPTGAVKRATVSPSEVAQSAVGLCVASATSAMQFGEQPGPVAFRVPLTARRN